MTDNGASKFRYGKGAHFCADLEKQWADHYSDFTMRRQRALCLNSCTSAIMLAVKTLASRDCPVLVPAFTFIAVPAAVVRAGYECELLPINEELVINLDVLEYRLQQLGGKATLLLSYMRGRFPDMDRLMEIITKYPNCVLIEDCAHAQGVCWQGRPLGTFGDGAVYSFQSNKIIDAGEGGMFMTRHGYAFNAAVVLSGAYESNALKHSMGSQDDSQLQDLLRKVPPYNLRMTEMQAQSIIAQLETLPQTIAATNEAGREFYEVNEHAVPIDDDGNDLVLDSIQLSIPMPLEIRMALFTQDYVATIQDRMKEIGWSGFTILGGDPLNARCFWNWRWLKDCISVDLDTTREIIFGLADMRITADDVGSGKRFADDLEGVLQQVTSTII